MRKLVVKVAKVVGSCKTDAQFYTALDYFELAKPKLSRFYQNYILGLIRLKALELRINLIYASSE